MAKNIDVLNSFVSGDKEVKSNNLTIEGDKLFSYDTCIAERSWVDGEIKFKVNATKYSSSTTTIQNQLLRRLAHDDIHVVTDVQMRVRSLI